MCLSHPFQVMRRAVILCTVVAIATAILARTPGATAQATPGSSDRALFLDGEFQRGQWTSDRTYHFDCWCTSP